MEKPPQIIPQPEESSNPERKEGISHISIEYKNKQYELECSSHDFEYPESIQQESAVLGYSRTIISKESLFEVISDICKDGDIDFEAEAITDLDSLGEKIDNEKSFTPVRKILDRVLRESILPSLSDGQYPHKCFLHQMGVDYNKEERVAFKEEFASNRFFLQKIYDLDYVKSKTDEQGFSQKLFNATGGLAAENTVKSGISIFNKQTGELVESGIVALLGKEEYYEGLKDGTLFASTPNSGFNMSVGDFFYQHKGGLTDTVPSFGFSMEGNKFLESYLHAALDIYTKKIEGTEKKDMKGVSAIVEELIYCDPEVQNIVFSENKNGKFIKVKGNEVALAQIVEKKIEEIESAHNIKLSDYLPEPDIVASTIKLMRMQTEYKKEVRLPVFIGSDELPQLNWGHASFAHFASSKGFNFIQFKHPDSVLKAAETDPEPLS